MIYVKIWCSRGAHSKFYTEKVRIRAMILYVFMFVLAPASGYKGHTRRSNRVLNLGVLGHLILLSGLYLNPVVLTHRKAFRPRLKLLVDKLYSVAWLLLEPGVLIVLCLYQWDYGNALLAGQRPHFPRKVKSFASEDWKVGAHHEKDLK